MITPPALKTGDKVAIVATARKVSRTEMEPVVAMLQSWGLNVVTGEHLYAEENQFAGSDEQRHSDLQQMLDDPDVRAIFCARGGYGTVRLIDQTDIAGLLRHPKWIVGYSDITVLHSHLHKHAGIETLHATMPINFFDNGQPAASAEVLRKTLFGEIPVYTPKPAVFSRPGNARGQVIGGNLSILYSLAATPSDIDTQGKILFIEDLDEYLYHIDRMMMNLKRSNKLANLAGLVVGGMSDMRDNAVPFGKTAEEIIADAVKEHSFPVLFGFPAGHLKDNMPLILGREAVLEVGPENASLTFIPPAATQAGTMRLLKPLLFISAFFALIWLLYFLLLGK